MKVSELVTGLGLSVVAGESGLEECFEGAYIGDLLSFVMSHAKEKNIWFTIQGHINSVAVASLLGLSAIVLTEKAQASAEMIAKANEEGIPVLSCEASSFELAVKWAHHFRQE